MKKVCLAVLPALTIVLKLKKKEMHSSRLIGNCAFLQINTFN